MSLTDKVALITGASKGIGASTALRLARDGASVAVNYLTDKDGADEVVRQIGVDKAIAIQADVSKVLEVTELVQKTVQKFGKIDIVIPLAGKISDGGLVDSSESAFDDAFAINVKGPFFLCQQAVPYMPIGSHIVLISSTLTAASTVMPHYLLYLATKGAIEQMVRVMSKDLGRNGICVNCVAPGPTKTKFFMSMQTEQSLKMVSNLNPNGRIGEPEEIADAIVLLCGHDSRWVMGQTLRVNGGMA